MQTSDVVPDPNNADLDIDVYGWVLEHRTVDVDAVATGTGRDADEVRGSVARLRASRLLHVSPIDPTVAFAVAPDTAAEQLVAPLEAQIREQQRAISGIREDLGRFLPHYLGRRSTGESLEVLESLEDVRGALNRASLNCTTEMLSSQPGGGSRVPEAMQEALRRDETMLQRGISMRTLYHHTARFNGPSQAYVAATSVLGAQYRTAHELFGRLIAFDRELAFIPVSDGSWGAVVIREPSTVAYLCNIFDQTWDLASPFSAAAGQGLEEVAREIHETIIRLLAAGLKDEAIARRLGMSLRTARRHIADIMQELGAGSRFQAGVAAAARGLLDLENGSDGSEESQGSAGDSVQPS
ncbi:response regulator transcription factor [Streptomyces virginiae]|uniref:response regulator transcription factor n=1 Tax=Streptomyces virginiae TaxID=1961 RepID=UPI00068B7245|nr:helix-turn-helix transcriptional regulator [Streptomyces virginiae]